MKIINNCKNDFIGLFDCFEEKCGIIIGTKSKNLIVIEQLIIYPNLSKTPLTNYRLGREAYINSYKLLKNNKILGCAHLHLESAQPSDKDFSTINNYLGVIFYPRKQQLTYYDKSGLIGTEFIKLSLKHRILSFLFHN